jgi:hypothetical protein
MLNELLCNVGQMNSKHFDTGRALGQIPASVSVFGNQSGLGRFPVKSALGQIGQCPASVKMFGIHLSYIAQEFV